MDIREYLKSEKRKKIFVPPSPAMDPKAKIKEYKFEKNYKQFFQSLSQQHTESLRRLNSMQKETAYRWKTFKDLIQAIFHWTPNNENFEQKYQRFSIYDPHSPVFVYTLPSPSVKKSIFSQQTQHEQTLPKDPNSQKQSYIFSEDYKKAFKLLMNDQKKVIEKLRVAKKRHSEITKKLWTLIEKALYPIEGIPASVGMMQRRKKKFKEYSKIEQTKPAFAPGFTPSQTNNPLSVPCTRVTLSSKQGTKPKISAEVVPVMNKQKSSPQSPPSSPLQMDRSGKILTTPSKIIIVKTESAGDKGRKRRSPRLSHYRKRKRRNHEENESKLNG